MAGDAPRCDLVFLGDYVDRGRDSKGVIALLLELQGPFKTHFLRGNHDQAMLDFLSEPASYRVWREFGAAECLLSYGVTPPEAADITTLTHVRDKFVQALPPSHLRFLSSLLPLVTIGDYLFVHAGIRPKVPIENQKLRDLLWIREEFLNHDEDFGKVVVHGHTPQTSPVRRHNRIGIDTGAYFSGRLTASVLEGTELRFLRT